jgi:hypothetical protein
LHFQSLAIVMLTINFLIEIIAIIFFSKTRDYLYMFKNVVWYFKVLSDDENFSTFSKRLKFVFCGFLCIPSRQNEDIASLILMKYFFRASSIFVQVIQILVFDLQCFA